jgi:hypothetical protein
VELAQLGEKLGDVGACLLTAHALDTSGNVVDQLGDVAAAVERLPDKRADGVESQQLTTLRVDDDGAPVDDVVGDVLAPAQGSQPDLPKPSCRRCCRCRDGARARPTSPSRNPSAVITPRRGQIAQGDLRRRRRNSNRRPVGPTRRCSRGYWHTDAWLSRSRWLIVSRYRPSTSNLDQGTLGGRRARVVFAVLCPTLSTSEQAGAGADGLAREQLSDAPMSVRGRK